MATIFVIITLAVSPTWSAWANGYGESAPWQFRTSADRANLSVNLDLIERKRGGYYDSFNPNTNVYSTTNIDRQFNCQVSSSATGNASDNGQTARSSSPDTRNEAGISSGANGNAATNAAGLPDSTLNNGQTNSGSQTSGVAGSYAGAGGGVIAANGGRTWQALNNQQTNGGNQQASVSGSEACSFGGTGGALN
ncbi:hypothetical protein [Aureimonas sp. ME7]|uniref:hypothetical protein n=1 Tax=Aureimonas sp. ME7 TaxID=2744252 RepID=UPI0015F45DF5|nr:hypothetical protein [Aureimonas sp. ME7]